MDGRLALAIVGLVVLAGCGTAPLGGGSADTPVETLTPAPVPETETKTKTPTNTPAASPPGVTNEIVEPSRLRSAHESFLDGRSFEWELTFDKSGESPFEQNKYTRRAIVAGDRFLIEQRYDTEPLTESLFVDETGGYLRIAAGNETRTESLREPGGAQKYVPTGRLIERYLTGLSLNVSTVERGGETYYRVHTTRGRPSALDTVGSPGIVTDYEVTAYVTPEGFVTSMVVRYDRTWNDSRQTVFFRFDYSSLGSATLTEPDWVGQVTTPTPGPEPTESSTATPTTGVTSTEPPAGISTPVNATTAGS